MGKILLLSCGELMLKGQNRFLFERKLVKNIKRSILECGESDIECYQGRVYIRPKNDDYKIEEALKKIQNISGIVAASLAWDVDKSLENIIKVSKEYMKMIIETSEYRTFKVECKRSDKLFPLTSPELAREIGGILLDEYNELTVDVHNPEFRLYIEVRDTALIYHEKLVCNCGLPVGTGGRGMLLLSGGIDSPVAGWMMAKRGLELEAIHYFSFPYTGLKAKEKVVDLAKILTDFTYKMSLHIIPFTEIQLYINENCPEDYSVIIMRRIMIKIANILGIQMGCKALITGECLGQVASQTIEALSVTNNNSELPIFRPLIGMDKTDIVKYARKIGTYETSVLPYEDCCTVFVPKHPKTKPKLEEVLQIEKGMDIDTLIEKAIKEREIVKL